MFGVLRLGGTGLCLKSLRIEAFCVVAASWRSESGPAFQGREQLHERIRVASATPENIDLHASLTRRR
jgi:hypothetical protein